jgi:hypothetical protein
LNASEINPTGQATLPIDFFREPDRNFEKGGRSFYFFDFDDNVVHLPTKIILFSKESGNTIEVSTQDYALIHPQLGHENSKWKDFEVKLSPPLSFQNFREKPKEALSPNEDQPLIQDMHEALRHPFLEWRGPSWGFFVYAVNNNRPISIITARGHHPHTIRRAINLLVQNRSLNAHPNYLSVYPLSHPEIKNILAPEDTQDKLHTSELKKRAIHQAVKDAFECYGFNPYHRFGMSDDDPKNVAVILKAMLELKEIYPENAFFVINTHGRQLIKEEVLPRGKILEQNLGSQQLSLI